MEENSAGLEGWRRRKEARRCPAAQQTRMLETPRFETKRDASEAEGPSRRKEREAKEEGRKKKGSSHSGEGEGGGEEEENYASIGLH